MPTMRARQDLVDIFRYHSREAGFRVARRFFAQSARQGAATTARLTGNSGANSMFLRQKRGWIPSLTHGETNSATSPTPAGPNDLLIYGARMISHSKFHALRLSQFRKDAEIAELENWEYYERIWVGEAIKFSEWLRPVDDPEALGSLAIDFNEFPKPAANRVLKAIGLPIRPGMSLEELKAVLGDPVKTLRFVPEQTTYNFLTAEPESYAVSCTVQKEGGLSYLTVMIPIDEEESD